MSAGPVTIDQLLAVAPDALTIRQLAKLFGISPCRALRHVLAARLAIRIMSL